MTMTEKRTVDAEDASAKKVNVGSSILGMGNPLLDIQSVVDDAFLEKYAIKLNDAILAEEKHMPIFDELKAKDNVKYIAGGATLNSCRIANWMGASSAYMGCIGKDENGKMLKELMDKEGVNAQFMEHPEAPTGVCGACIVGGERSLVTNLEAANNYKIAHMEENKDVVDVAQVVYSAGYFLTVCPEAMTEVSAKKTYAMNLSAPFLMQVPPFKEAMTNVYANADIIFGNESEALTFAGSEKWEETDITKIAQKMAVMKSNKESPRRVVITQGKDKTIVVTGSEEPKLFDVEILEQDKLVDTNGAGDAFVGGYLAGLVKGKSLEQCVLAGHYAARQIIQVSGTTLPDSMDFNWE